MRGRSTSKTATKSPYDQNPRSRSSSPTAKLQDSAVDMLSEEQISEKDVAN